VTRQVGIFGGTFNPIHHGHLLIAEFAREQFQLEKIIFVTSGTPPHRDDELLDQESRHRLVLAAVSTNSYFEASDVELKRKGLSYTADTMEYFHEELGQDVKLNFIIGGDNFVQIGSWHKVDELIKSCRILVAPRLEYETEQTNPLVLKMQKTESNPDPEKYNMPKDADWALIDFPGVAISSSGIRERLREGKSVRYMVPREVNEMLMSEGYYTEHHAVQSKTKSNANSK
jgi:nicotinate-nucleotide adenylyltransferase